MLKIMIPLTALMYLSLKKSQWVQTMSSLFISTGASLILFPTFQTASYSSAMTLDSLSALLITLTLWVSALMIMASQSVKILNLQSEKFAFMIMILTTVLVMAFSVNSTIMFYIFFEASLIPTFLLVYGWGYQPERIQASSYLMMYTITASLPLLITIVYKSYSSSSTFLFFQEGANSPMSLMANWWWVMVIAAFLVKMPMYSVHLWLPKAHVEAPVAGSMILAAVLLKLGSYGLIRMSFMFPQHSSTLKPPLMALSLVGAALTSFVCMRQTDLKALIAYSSVAHMGLLIAGTLTNSSFGWQGATVIMVAHGLVSSALFVLANTSYENTGSRSVILTKGILAMYPAMSTMWFFSAAANMATPPSINLFGEVCLFTSVLFISPWCAVPLIILTLISGAYSLHLYTSTNHGSPNEYSNTPSSATPRNMLLISMHLAPAFIMFINLDTLLPWF